MLGILVGLVGWMHPDYNFRWILTYLRDTLVKELDFELEAENMKTCSRQLSNLSYIRVPKVIYGILREIVEAFLPIRTSDRITRYILFDLIHSIGCRLFDVETSPHNGMD